MFKPVGNLHRHLNSTYVHTCRVDTRIEILVDFRGFFAKFKHFDSFVLLYTFTGTHVLVY